MIKDVSLLLKTLLRKHPFVHFVDHIFYTRSFANFVNLSVRECTSTIQINIEKIRFFSATVSCYIKVEVLFNADRVQVCVQCAVFYLDCETRCSFSFIMKQVFKSRRVINTMLSKFPKLPRFRITEGKGKAEANVCTSLGDCFFRDGSAIRSKVPDYEIHRQVF